jgi:hypothetical protein
MRDGRLEHEQQEGGRHRCGPARQDTSQRCRPKSFTIVTRGLNFGHDILARLDRLQSFSA